MQKLCTIKNKSPVKTAQTILKPKPNQVKFSVDTTDKERTSPPKQDPKPIVKHPVPFRTQPFNDITPKDLNYPNQQQQQYPHQHQQQQQMMNFGGGAKPYGMPSSTASQPAMYGSSVQQPSMGYGGQMMGTTPQQPSMQQSYGSGGNAAGGYGQFGSWKQDERATPSWPWSSMNPTVSNNSQWT